MITNITEILPDIPPTRPRKSKKFQADLITIRLPGSKFN
jgi:hypothetical protein